MRGRLPPGLRESKTRPRATPATGGCRGATRSQTEEMRVDCGFGARKESRGSRIRKGPHQGSAWGLSCVELTPGVRGVHGPVFYHV